MNRIYRKIPGFRYTDGIRGFLFNLYFLICIAYSLSLALAHVERSDGLSLLLWQSDFAELVLILCNILLQSQKQTLSVLRSKNHTAIDYRLWQTRQNTGKVGDEF